MTRRIYLGWKHEGQRRGAGPSSVLVTAGQGGGQQVRDLPRGMSLEELMESAKGKLSHCPLKYFYCTVMYYK